MTRGAGSAGIAHHVMNRAIEGKRLFSTAADYRAFEKIIAEAQERVPARLLAYCLMPNHWHLLLWPTADDDLRRLMHWATMTHARRWRDHHGSTGRGHLYQGSYRACAVEPGTLFVVGRYIERNAQTASLVARAEHWRWSSLWRRLHPDVGGDVPELSPWPQPLPADWVELVNTPQTAREIHALEDCLERGRPHGPSPWQIEMARRLGLESTLRGRGRPPKPAS